jgi:hypothetical protein
MGSPFHIMAGGKFPVQSGKPVLITRAEFEDCCCGNDYHDCDPKLKNKYNITFAGLTGSWSVWNGLWVVTYRPYEWLYPANPTFDEAKIVLYWWPDIWAVQIWAVWQTDRPNQVWWGSSDPCIIPGTYPWHGGIPDHQSQATCVVS